MKIAVIRFSSFNIGDDLQEIALRRLLPRVDLEVDRDDTSAAAAWGDDVRWIIYGWHCSGRHKVWPPPGRARKLYAGFHANDYGVLPPAEVGCRDRWTELLCRDAGIACWMSYCLTMTFEPYDGPRRGTVPADLSEEREPALPPRIAADAVRVTHRVRRDCDRQAEALRRLDLYRRARLVATSRLHVLLPCLAMGTPVVFHPPAREHPVARVEPRLIGFAGMGWRFEDAPWDDPRPKTSPEAVAALVRPLCKRIRRFVAD